MACRILLGAALGWLGATVFTDSVMGGSSTANITLIGPPGAGPGGAGADQLLLFQGEIVAHNGGFAIVQIPLSSAALVNLGNASNLTFAVSGGGGHTFAFRAAPQNETSATPGYYSEFTTNKDGSNSTHTVRIADMKPMHHGLPVSAPPLRASDIAALGILATKMHIRGPFSLTVHWVAAVDEPSAPARVADVDDSDDELFEDAFDQGVAASSC